MRFRMRQIERAAENVAELVMKRHADGAKHRTAEPRAVQRIRSRLDVVRRAHDLRQAAAERANPLLRHQRDDRIRVLAVQPFDAVSHRIHAARCRKFPAAARA